MLCAGRPSRCAMAMPRVKHNATTPPQRQPHASSSFFAAPNGGRPHARELTCAPLVSPCVFVARCTSGGASLVGLWRTPNSTHSCYTMTGYLSSSPFKFASVWEKAHFGAISAKVFAAATATLHSARVCTCATPGLSFPAHACILVAFQSVLSRRAHGSITLGKTVVGAAGKVGHASHQAEAVP